MLKDKIKNWLFISYYSRRWEKEKKNINKGYRTPDDRYDLERKPKLRKELNCILEMLFEIRMGCLYDEENPYEVTKYGAVQPVAYRERNPLRYWNCDKNLRNVQDSLEVGGWYKKWSISFYGHEHMMCDTYRVISLNGLRAVSRLEHDKDFFKDYEHIVCRYGCRMQHIGGIKIKEHLVQRIVECEKIFKGKIFFPEKIPLHVCGECSYIKMKSGKVAITMECELSRYLELDNVDIITESEAKALVGRIIAIEAIYDCGEDSWKVSWIRRLTFDRAGWINCFGENVEEKDCHVGISSDPRLCRDYDAEYGTLTYQNVSYEAVNVINADLIV